MNTIPDHDLRSRRIAAVNDAVVMLCNAGRAISLSDIPGLWFIDGTEVTTNQLLSIAAQHRKQHG